MSDIIPVMPRQAAPALTVPTVGGGKLVAGRSDP
jgi:hypothetical protein